MKNIEFYCENDLQSRFVILNHLLSLIHFIFFWGMNNYLNFSVVFNQNRNLRGLFLFSLFSLPFLFFLPLLLFLPFLSVFGFMPKVFAKDLISNVFLDLIKLFKFMFFIQGKLFIRRFSFVGLNNNLLFFLVVNRTGIELFN